MAAERGMATHIHPSLATFPSPPDRTFLAVWKSCFQVVKHPPSDSNENTENLFTATLFPWTAAASETWFPLWWLGLLAGNSHTGPLSWLGTLKSVRWCHTIYSQLDLAIQQPHRGAVKQTGPLSEGSWMLLLCRYKTTPNAIHFKSKQMAEAVDSKGKRHYKQDELDSHFVASKSSPVLPKEVTLALSNGAFWRRRPS